MKTTGLLASGMAFMAALFLQCTTTTGPTTPHFSGATLRIDNNSTADIGWVYLSTTSSSIGTDRLGSATITSGTVYDFVKLTPGDYEVRAVHLYRHDTAWAHITLTAGSTYTWTLTDNDFYGGFKITNSSSYSITYVYLSQDNTTWGTDWLGSSSITPGSSYTIPDVPTGYVNMKVLTSSSSAYCLQLLNIPSDGSFSIELTNSDFPSNPHGSLKVVNNSSTKIYYLYMRPSGTTVWSSDMLGTSTIAAGEQCQINGIDPGIYDFYVEESGQTYSAEVDNQTISAANLLSWKVTALY
jgi:hypothetical protein